MTSEAAAPSNIAPQEAGKQLDLFRHLTILEWLPDETLYSLVTRLHYLSGFRSETATSNALFGRQRAGLRHDFQHGLSEFEHRTNGSLGPAEQILLNRTILPLFLCFNDREFSSKFTRSFVDGYWDSTALGRPFITGGTRACNPLKACPDCIEHDQDTYGVPYWHRSHQFPGVWACAIHESPLMEARAADSQSEKYKLKLPRATNLQPPILGPASNAKDDKRQALLRALRDSIHEAAENYSSLQIPPSSVISLFEIGTQENGFKSVHDRFHVKQMGESYLDFVSPLSTLPEFSEFIGRGESTVSELVRLLRGAPRRTHPIRYILIALWLFGSWSTFKARLTAKA